MRTRLNGYKIIKEKERKKGRIPEKIMGQVSREKRDYVGLYKRRRGGVTGDRAKNMEKEK